MDQLFLSILNMSITASYVILFVILIRLLLKRLPKAYSYGLWLIVMVRLLVPFSISSLFSMIPANTKVIPKDIVYAPKPEIQSGIAVVDGVVNNSLPAAATTASVNPIQIWIFIGRCIWLAGILILLIYSIITTLKLVGNLKSSKHLRDNIYTTNQFETPFVFGLLRPKIYIPFGLSETEHSYIVKHEETHIKRYDHIIKFTFFIATSIHWFNPLVWLAFHLMTKDMELCCDEKVIVQMGNDIKKDYSHSLLSLSSDRRIIGSPPLAFGGENIKQRIKNIINYKKPGFWANLVGSVVIVVAVMGLLSNPKPSAILSAEEDEMIRNFIGKYYAQLSYTEEEQEEIQLEMQELADFIGIDEKSDKPASGEIRPNGFYYFYKENLTPQLYDTMTRNRRLPDFKMIGMGYDKSKIKNITFKRENDVIHTAFKVECYIAEDLIDEKIIELDFGLKKIEDRLYIDSINGNLSYTPNG